MIRDADGYRELYDRRTDGVRLSGFYNENYLVQVPDRSVVVVRVPKNRSDGLEPRQFDEAAILAHLQASGLLIPKLLWGESSPEFQVHAYISGELLNDSCPRTAPLPDHFATDVARLFRTLSEVDMPDMAQAAAAYPLDSTCQGFFRRLLSWEERVWRRSCARYGDFFRWIGLQASPFTLLAADADFLAERPLRLCHGDVQRLNCIVQDGRTWFLDWELCLWADPLWDIAAHLHRMRYLPDEESQINSALLGSGCLSAADFADLDRYMALESLKSVVNDAVRYLDSVRGNADDDQIRFFAEEYEWKLVLAGAHASTEPRSAEALLSYFERFREREDR